MEPREITSASPECPDALRRVLGTRAPRSLLALGTLTALHGTTLALFCSAQCPGDIILKLYDHVQALRDEGVTVISGFHSSMEKECLRILLRGKQPVIICPARAIVNMRLPRDWKTPLASGRLLILSCFKNGEHRVTKNIAERRNEFVAALATEILIAHAAPGGRLESLAGRLESQGRRVTRLAPSPS